MIMPRRPTAPALALAFAALLAACGSEPSANEPVYSDPTTAVYAPALKVNPSTMTAKPGGLLYQDRVTGTGATATTESTVSVTYAGYLPTGRQFDAGTTQFPLSGVVPGFRDGIAGMRVGGERTIVMPPALGYGDAPPRGSGIPANSVLVFNVKLNSIP
jgi:FKBP-type peptidyl-prolyl cis-trans isomerase